MATQQLVNDDAVSLDGDEIQGPAQPAQPTVSSTSRSNTSNSPASRPAIRPTTSSAALALLNAKINKAIEDKGFSIFEPTDKHPTTRALERKIGATVLELADFWFCQGSPYDHVCLARANWREFKSTASVGEFYDRGEFHLQLYAYTLRRASAVGVLLARGYEVLDGGLSATDNAFAVVAEALVLTYHDMKPNIINWPARGRKRTLMIDHPRLLKALEIVMGNPRDDGRGKVPLRYRVKSKQVVGDDGAGRAKFGDVEEVAFFRFNGDGVEKAWEMEMEVVAKADAELFCKREEYELPVRLW